MSRKFIRKTIALAIAGICSVSVALAAAPENKKNISAPAEKVVRQVKITEIQRGEVIDAVYGDVDGDGVDEEIVLLGNKFADNAKFMRDLYVITKDRKSGKVKGYVRPVDCAGYNAHLTLADVTGNGVSNVILAAVTGGTGGIVDYRILDFFAGRNEEIFKREHNRGIDVSGRFLPQYRALITFPTFHKSVELDLPGEKELYTHLNVYDQEGGLKASGQYPYVQNLVNMAVIDVNGDGVCEVITTQRVVGVINSDSLGYIRTQWQYYAGVWQPRSVDFRTALLTKMDYRSQPAEKKNLSYKLSIEKIQQEGNLVSYPRITELPDKRIAWKLNSVIEDYLRAQLSAVQNRGTLEIYCTVQYAGPKYLSILLSGAGTINNKTMQLIKPFNLNAATGDEVTLKQLIKDLDSFWQTVNKESKKTKKELLRKDYRDFYFNGRQLIIINNDGHEYILPQGLIAPYIVGNKLKMDILTGQSDGEKQQKKSKNKGK